MRRALALLVVAVGACGGGDGVVDLTIALDAGVSDATVAAIRGLTLDVSGLDTETVNQPLAQPFAVNRQERVVVRSAAAGAVTIAVTARDANGAPLLFGQASFTLTPGQESAQTVTLSASLPALDGGADFAFAPDLAGSDLAGVDLNAPDLARPDLAEVVCPTGLPLCDGFESGTIDAVIWDQATTTTLGTVTPDNTRAHRGSWSLHLHTSAVASGGTVIATVGETHTFTPAGQTFYVRGFYYFQSGASTAVATIFDASQTSGPGQGVSLAIDHDALSIYDGFAAGSYTASTTPKIPLDTWSCIEWEVDTGAPNQMHAWVNGTPVTQLDLMQATTGTPQIGGLDVGIAIYPPNAATAALDVWLDDVIVDHAPIGCAK